MAPPPASDITGTCAAPAVSTTASEVGVTDEPMMRSTLSSLIRRCAFLVAVVVSVLSLRMVKRTFSPAISPGHIFSACSAGMPSDAPGPVVEIVTPMWMSASAGTARQREAEGRGRSPADAGGARSRVERMRRTLVSL